MSNAAPLSGLSTLLSMGAEVGTGLGSCLERFSIVVGLPMSPAPAMVVLLLSCRRLLPLCVGATSWPHGHKQRLKTKLTKPLRFVSANPRVTG